MDIKIPKETMTCDTERGDGNVYFYEEYLEWINRSTGGGFRLRYDSIADIRIVRTTKKEVIVITKQQKRLSFFLYKADTFVSILYEMINRANGQPPIVDAEVAPSNKDEFLNQLERLAKLHESGALSDEEFKQAKDKLLR